MPEEIDSVSANWRLDDQRTREHFDRLVNQHGSAVHATDWGSAKSQQLRFEVLTSIGDLNGCRVLDVGCGQAGLLDFLAGHGNRVEYHGVDLAKSMIDLCRAKFPDSEFEVRNILDERLEPDSFDYSFASGVFYLRQHRPMAFLARMLEAMWTASRRGVAFNSLSAWSTSHDEGEFYADPIEVLAICRRFTSRLCLRHDYHPRDFSILMWKPAA